MIPTTSGVAPGVNIVALRVTDSTNTASLTSVANALQWVINNHAQYNITAVNMSLSDGGNYAQNWFANDGGAGQQVTNLIGQLTAMNIPVIAATGNSFNGQQGEGFAAIVAGTISVTATDLSGNLLSNAQRLGSAIGGASATTIAAPGRGLDRPSGDSGTATVEGTSFATALVTGGVTLLQQIYQSRFGISADGRPDQVLAPGRVRPGQRPGHRHHDRRARTSPRPPRLIPVAGPGLSPPSAAAPVTHGRTRLRVDSAAGGPRRRRRPPRPRRPGRATGADSSAGADHARRP